jgi:uncharacterized protein with NAD-binding domain and iron-sulfur cluster
MVQPRKIAILGGGVGALSAAFNLSSEPGWRERYEITVYQQGWRLGGKGASGRNARFGQRIEEHGLHIWFGYYANAFALLRTVYQELGRAPDAPLATWDQAFRPHDYIALAEQAGQSWRPWHMVLPRRPGEPGTGSEPVTPWRLALEAAIWLRRWHSELRTQASQAAVRPETGAPFDALLALTHALPEDAREHSDLDRSLLARAIERVSRQLDNAARLAAPNEASARRVLEALNVVTTILKGMLADNVFARGFDVINDEDLRTWLARHGGNPELCLDSTLVRSTYAQVFAYEDGVKPNLEAGTGLRFMMRMSFAYRGSLMYRMQAGMGDAVFAPLYQVLAARGVRFEFFHRVEDVVADGEQVDSIRMTVQAALKAGAYQPLVDVKGLPCWPNKPDLSQFEPAQAALMQEHGVDLESYWSDWPALHQRAFGTPLPERTLQRGIDFDDVVFGLPVASLAASAPSLLAASPVLQAASSRVRTVVTQAYQVWLDRELAQLGWNYQPDGQEPILTGFGMPYDTWAPMDQVLASEDWPAASAPRSVHYFCGAMAMDAPPPATDTGYPARCAALAKQQALEQLEQRIGALWPAAAEQEFPWQWLVDPEGGTGPARFDRQFWRANVDPSERYVLSVAGSSAYRPASNGAGLSNLYLTGDWIRTGVNAGCVEAAVMAGMQASRALAGYPSIIEGDSDF